MHLVPEPEAHSLAGLHAACWQKAQELLQQGKLEDSQVWMRRSVESSPDAECECRAHCALAIVAERTRDYSAALHHASATRAAYRAEEELLQSPYFSTATAVGLLARVQLGDAEGAAAELEHLCDTREQLDLPLVALLSLLVNDAAPSKDNLLVLQQCMGMLLLSEAQSAECISPALLQRLILIDFEQEQQLSDRQKKSQSKNADDEGTEDELLTCRLRLLEHYESLATALQQQPNLVDKQQPQQQTGQEAVALHPLAESVASSNLHV